MKIRFLGPVDHEGGAMLVTFESAAEATVLRMLMSYDVTLPREVKRHLYETAEQLNLGTDFVHDMMSAFHMEISRMLPGEVGH